jgi:hypothetical protein
MDQHTLAALLEDLMDSVRDTGSKSKCHVSGAPVLGPQCLVHGTWQPGLKGLLAPIKVLAFIGIVFNVDLEDLDVRTIESIAGGALAHGRVDHHSQWREVGGLLQLFKRVNLIVT